MTPRCSAILAVFRAELANYGLPDGRSLNPILPIVDAAGRAGHGRDRGPSPRRICWVLVRQMPRGFRAVDACAFHPDQAGHSSPLYAIASGQCAILVKLRIDMEGPRCNRTELQRLSLGAHSQDAAAAEAAHENALTGPF
jgi:hypothetical protein